MRLTALGSSSAGNCFVLEFGMGEGKESISIMVECGYGYQTLVSKATKSKVSLSDIAGCLITHSHKDHSAAACDIARRGIQIYATPGTLEAIGLKGTGWPMEYGIPVPIAPGLKAMAFRVEHDAPQPAGFIIKTKFETVIFAIDASRWVDDLSEIAPDFLLIEANYDKTLMEQEQFSLRRRASIPDMNRFKVNERIKRSHMSFDDCLIHVSKVKKGRLKAVFLTHLSDRMSAPSLWKTQVSAMTGVPCYVARKDCGIE